LVKEVGRIRHELLDRNEEVSALRARLAEPGQDQQLQAQLQTLEQENEGIAARSLETAGQLRRANERIAELEQSLVSRQAVAYADAAQAPPPPVVSAPMPGPPRVPMPQMTPPPRTKPPPRVPPQPPPPPRVADGHRAPPRPPSRGFPDEPTVKTAPPQMTPPTRGEKRRQTGSIFPPPRSKKDLLD
jgi:hypothetical protein